MGHEKVIGWHFRAVKISLSKKSIRMLNWQRLNVIFAILGWILIIVIGCLSNRLAEENTVVRWISIDQLDAVIEKKSPLIVDLRKPLEYISGHLPGAVNVPLDDLRANRSLLDAYRDKPVLFYCRTVNRTERALWMLEGRGFKSIYALRGGYQAFRELYKH